MEAEEFKDARVFAGLSRQQAAKFLGVSLRTIGHWETGKAPPGLAATRLLQVLHHGRIAHPAWQGFSVNRAGALCSPESREFYPADFVWWSLTVERARELSRLTGLLPVSEAAAAPELHRRAPARRSFRDWACLFNQQGESVLLVRGQRRWGRRGRFGRARLALGGGR